MGAAYATRIAPRQIRQGAIMKPEKLITMINQIAEFHRRKPPESAAAEIATHVERYWDPTLRRAAYTHLDSGAPGLSPNAAAALTLLRTRDTAAA